MNVSNTSLDDNVTTQSSSVKRATTGVARFVRNKAVESYHPCYLSDSYLLYVT